MLDGRELQEELLEELNQAMTEEQIIDSILGYFDSDTTCQCLYSICRDWDIDVEELINNSTIKNILK